ncbi:FkbM family methyltransferase, partial [Proteus mirabilis]|uniref:FkbM family methyltransferase n=1 Tax=Proteus mirabilis TaxID=584 RepID=UPI0034D4E795
MGRNAQPSHSIWCESTNAEAIVPCLDMEAVVGLCGGQAIEVLHMDTQGAELPFLESMSAAVARGLVRFLVVSTHHSSISGSKTSHEDCVRSIRAMNGKILAE